MRNLNNIDLTEKYYIDTGDTGVLELVAARAACRVRTSQKTERERVIQEREETIHEV